MLSIYTMSLSSRGYWYLNNPLILLLILDQSSELQTWRASCGLSISIWISKHYSKCKLFSSVSTSLLPQIFSVSNNSTDCRARSSGLDFSFPTHQWIWWVHLQHLFHVIYLPNFQPYHAHLNYHAHLLWYLLLPLYVSLLLSSSNPFPERCFKNANYTKSFLCLKACSYFFPKAPKLKRSTCCSFKRWVNLPLLNCISPCTIFSFISCISDILAIFLLL